MGIGMEEAYLKELVEVRVHCTPGQLPVIDPGGGKCDIVIDLDTLNPSEHQQAPRDILIIDAGNRDGGIIFEHRPKPFGIGCLAYIVKLFSNMPAQIRRRNP